MNKIIKPGERVIGSNNRYVEEKQHMDRQKEYNELLKMAQSSDYAAQIKNPDEEKVQKALKEFFEKPIDSRYQYVHLLDRSSVIVEIFRYEEESTFLVDEKGKPRKQFLILPYAKVLKVTNDPISESSKLEPGDILYTPEKVSVIERSIEWLAWDKSQQVERPTPQDPEPNEYVGLIPEWRSSSMFILDKNNPTEDDLWTFILPERMFKVKVDKELILK